MIVLVFAQLVAVAFSTARATPAAPTNLVVTRMRDPGGAYFHITFKKLSVPIDSAYKYSYLITRWWGSVPDTTGATALTYVQQEGDSIATYDDHSPIFNYLPNDSLYRSTFSYSVCTIYYEDSTKRNAATFSPWVTPVSVMLDTTMITFSHTPPVSNTAHLDDTLHGTFTAAASNGATVRYRMSTHYGSAAYGLDPVTGNFWACLSDRTVRLPDQSSFTILSTDSAGHSAFASINLLVVPMEDTVVVSFSDQANHPINEGTRCYYGLMPRRPQDSIVRTQHQTTLLDADGKISIVCDSGQFFIRLHVEGFAPVWLIDSKGDTLISASRNADVKLTAANTRSISGRVGGVKDSAIAGATVMVYRAWEMYDYSNAKFVDSVHTNARGIFSIQVAEGDSIISTNGIYVMASAEGYQGSPEWYVQKLNQQLPFGLVLDKDYDSINFAFPIRDYTPPPKATIEVTISGMSVRDSNAAVVIVYNVNDSNNSIVQIDTVRNGDNYILLSVGNYLFFAQPLDTGYVGGYYKRGGYAATWQEADTFAFSSVNFLYNVSIVVKKDSSIARRGSGGSPISGMVSGDSLPIGNAHLLLYKVVGAPAGTAITTEFVTATLTNGAGNYSFAHIASGTYELDLDIVGKPLLKIGGIIVDGSSMPVNKDITVNTTSVFQDVNAPYPAASILNQNYPNPFSESTRFALARTLVGNESNSGMRLAVYDVLGKEISDPNVLTMHAKEVIVDAHALQTGVYVLKGSIGGVRVSKAFVVRR